MDPVLHDPLDPVLHDPLDPVLHDPLDPVLHDPLDPVPPTTSALHIGQDFLYSSYFIVSLVNLVT